MKQTEKVVKAYFDRNRIVETELFDTIVSLIVVIPVKNDLEIIDMLDSLDESAKESNDQVGVVVVVNHHDDDLVEVKSGNQTIIKRLREDSESDRWRCLKLHVVAIETTDRRQRGVGYARKKGMDLAAYYFVLQGENGIIASLDADCKVSGCYVRFTLDHYRQYGWRAAIYRIEHRLEGLEPNHRYAMESYELSLLYAKMAQRYIGHPYGFITLGSAFAVSARSYIEQGGMNCRQAGEDFYFLQKLIATGACREILAVTVYPSARLSFRTPFGTGQAVASIMNAEEEFKVHCFCAYEELKVILDYLDSCYKCTDETLKNTLSKLSDLGFDELYERMNLKELIIESNRNSSSYTMFYRRFFNYFNGFKLLRYLNDLHRSYYNREPVLEAVNALFVAIGEKPACSISEGLSRIRFLEKSGIPIPISP